MEVNLTELAITAASIVAAAAGFVATGRWLLKRLRELIEREVSTPARHTARQLATSNGHTVAEYVEDLTKQVKTVEDKMGALTGWATENRDTAKRAEAKADQALGAVNQTNNLLATLIGQKD